MAIPRELCEVKRRPPRARNMDALCGFILGLDCNYGRAFPSVSIIWGHIFVRKAKHPYFKSSLSSSAKTSRANTTFMMYSTTGSQTTRSSSRTMRRIERAPASSLSPMRLSSSISDSSSSIGHRSFHELSGPPLSSDCAPLKPRMIRQLPKKQQQPLRTYLPLHRTNSDSSNSSLRSSGHSTSSSRSASPPPSYKKKVSSRFSHILQQLLNFEQLAQLLMMVLILLMVVHYYHHANTTHNLLLRFRDNESALLMQLQKIERHSMTLHQSIQNRMARAGMDTEELVSASLQLEDLSTELHGQVSERQRSIQRQALSHIVEQYGEGPVKLVLDVDFADEDETDILSGSSTSSALEITLWPDTPHSAWTLLEQVERRRLDGSKLSLSENGSFMQVTPEEADTSGRGRLQFAERPRRGAAAQSKWHHAWTVGVRDVDGTLQLYVNLKDNSESLGHETCIGRVSGGYDTLQRILMYQRGGLADGGTNNGISIRQAVALHMTKGEIDALH